MEVTILLLLAGVLLVLPALLTKLVGKYFPAASLSQPGKPALRLPPGPWQLPVIGSLHHVLLLAWRHDGLLHRAMRELSGRHGPVMLLRLGAVPTLVVSSAEAAKEVLKTHDTAFASRHLTPTLDVLTIGGRDILFSPYGDLWRQLRRISVLELFSPRRVQSFRRIREEEAGRLLSSVADSCAAAGGGGAVVDIGERICRAINETVVRSAIGGRCTRRDELLRELQTVGILTSGFNFADLYPSSRLVRRLSHAMRETERCNRDLRDIVGDIIREQNVDGGQDTEEEEETNLLAVLLRLQRDGDDALTTDIISTVVMDIFGAGSETSSTTLEWALSELARNPPVMRRAQAEVREAFKGQQRLTEADTARLRYLPLVVKETLRLHLPVPFLLPRECREACRVMNYDVPRGTKVLVNAWAIARDATYWDDPEAFRPERFEGGGGDVDFRGGDFEFIPFGAGRRMCPGMAMGLVNMELALAGLLYHFDWTLLDGDDDGKVLDMSESFGITVQKKSKLLLRATPCVPCSY